MTEYDANVFVNCPFDEVYEEIFRAVSFCITRCGLRVRCALETEDSSQVRIDKIFAIIEECRFAVHDLSRTELDASTGLPRFNMPLEWGVFLGAKRFGRGRQREKSCVILDGDLFRYQKFISDIAGQDIRSHENDSNTAIRVVRDWLRAATKRTDLPGARLIISDYLRLRDELPSAVAAMKLHHKEMTFLDYMNFVTVWLNKGG